MHSHKSWVIAAVVVAAAASAPDVVTTSQEIIENNQTYTRRRRPTIKCLTDIGPCFRSVKMWKTQSLPNTLAFLQENFEWNVVSTRWRVDGQSIYTSNHYCKYDQHKMRIYFVSFQEIH